MDGLEYQGTRTMRPQCMCMGGLSHRNICMDAAVQDSFMDGLKIGAATRHKHSKPSFGLLARVVPRSSSCTGMGGAGQYRGEAGTLEALRCGDVIRLKVQMKAGARESDGPDACLCAAVHTVGPGCNLLT